MKICIPIETNEVLKSKVFDHFGSAAYFIVYDTDKKSHQIISNSDKHHIYGMCHPLKVLENQYIDVVVCRGMGKRAVLKLNEGGIRVFRVNSVTAQEVIDSFQEGRLEEITVDTACTDHSCH